MGITEATTTKRRRFGGKRIDRLRQRLNVQRASANPIDAVKLLNSRVNTPVRSRFVPGAKKEKKVDIDVDKLLNKRKKLFKSRVRIQRPSIPSTSSSSENSREASRSSSNAARSSSPVIQQLQSTEPQIAQTGSRNRFATPVRRRPTSAEELASAVAGLRTQTSSQSSSSSENVKSVRCKFFKGRGCSEDEKR